MYLHIKSNIGVGIRNKYKTIIALNMYNHVTYVGFTKQILNHVYNGHLCALVTLNRSVTVLDIEVSLYYYNHNIIIIITVVVI